LLQEKIAKKPFEIDPKAENHGERKALRQITGIPSPKAH